MDKVITLRKEFQVGSWRIKWYLERYHDVNISESSVSIILKRFGVGGYQRLNIEVFDVATDTKVASQPCPSSKQCRLLVVESFVV